MMAISENKRVITCFPLAQHEWTLTAGDVVGFDFNRELHIIRNHETDINTSFRIALKLHYIVCVQWRPRRAPLRLPFPPPLPFLLAQIGLLARSF